MVNTQPHYERRKQKRHVLRDGAYAFLRPPANKLGQIIDISLSGLAFSYFANGEVSMESTGLDLLSEEGITLENIPFTTINDFILPNEQPFSQITMRRRCIKFDSLSLDAQKYLHTIIATYSQDVQNGNKA